MIGKEVHNTNNYYSNQIMLYFADRPTYAGSLHTFFKNLFGHPFTWLDEDVAY